MRLVSQIGGMLLFLFILGIIILAINKLRKRSSRMFLLSYLKILIASLLPYSYQVCYGSPMGGGCSTKLEPLILTITKQWQLDCFFRQCVLSSVGNSWEDNILFNGIFTVLILVIYYFLVSGIFFIGKKWQQKFKSHTGKKEIQD